MRVVLDTCVLIPTPIRVILLGLAERDLFFPLWSKKIINEWEFFIGNNRKEFVDSTRIEILLMTSKWNSSIIRDDPILESTLFLPDKNDRHVLATAITGQAEVLLTNNLKDFPPRVLAKYGIIPRNVDSFVLELFYEDPQLVKPIVLSAFDLSADYTGRITSKKSFLKKHGLPRIAKAIIH